MTIRWRIEQVVGSSSAVRPECLSAFAVIDAHTATLALARSEAIGAVIDCATAAKQETFVMVRLGRASTRSAELRALDRWSKTATVDESSLAPSRSRGAVGPLTSDLGTVYMLWSEVQSEDASRVELLDKRHPEATFISIARGSFDAAEFATRAWVGASYKEDVFGAMEPIARRHRAIAWRCFGRFDDREAGVELCGDRETLTNIGRSLAAKLAVLPDEYSLPR